MRRRLAATLALSLLLAAALPASAQAQSASAPVGSAPLGSATDSATGNTATCAQHAADFAALIGRTEAEARTALGGMAGIRTIRAGGPATPMTRDYRPDRATILLTAPEGGRVERILCG